MIRWPLVVLSLLSVPAFADETRDLWMDKCKNCHGEDGRADTKTGRKEKVADISAPQWQKKRTDADIRKVIEEGSSENRKMKAYKDRLTPEQIDLLVGFIRDLKPNH
ncbi:MAG: cytochrome c [Myxococcota bacterium]|nr:cytochrome c [Myxococcota bacterium]